MTATPIPRTLAMTFYGDLDVSVIDELPPGRKPIHTIHRRENHRAKLLTFIHEQLQLGRQAYIVYPLIQESEKLDFKNLEDGYAQIEEFFKWSNSKESVEMVQFKLATQYLNNLSFFGRCQLDRTDKTRQTSNDWKGDRKGLLTVQKWVLPIAYRNFFDYFVLNNTFL